MSSPLEIIKQYVNNPPDLIAIALAEDIGSGDITCESFVPAGHRSSARIFSKQNSIVAAGVEVAAEVLHLVDETLEVRIISPSGSTLSYGDTALEITGLTRSILTAERTSLNFLQQLSGVATLTRKFVDAVRPHPTRILDTRKTTPGLRALEKAAVLSGGGTNHRFGLYDMAMVKDNHVDTTDIPHLIANIAAYRKNHPGRRLELEAQSLAQVHDFLALDGVDVIMLDNMTLDDMREAVQMRGSKAVRYEASGGVTLDTVGAIAATGVDFISVGALTHSAPAVDFSLSLAPL
jgi:nicotinate-nucleotide pyrophosphorylase (carboxylating)